MQKLTAKKDLASTVSVKKYILKNSAGDDHIMKSNEKNNSKASKTPVIIIYIIAYIFLMIAMIKIPDSKFKGVMAQIQVLLSAFVVLVMPKAGYRSALILNIINSGTVIMNILRLKSMGVPTYLSALPGTVIPVSTIFLITILFVFSNKVTENNKEISKNYEQLMETNRIIKEKDEKLSYLAYYDILTSLPNRHLFIEKIDETILNASNTPFTVILADLDNFKLINNTYGNTSGDILLADYAQKLKKFCGDSIFIGRIGGNEYGFIIQGNMTESNILNYIEKIQNIIAEPVQINNDMVSSTASFGIASYPNNAINSSDMLRCLNSAVSYAKSNGKNRPCFYEQR